MDITDIAGFAAVADKANIPLVIDSTVTTPILVKPKDFGAHIVVHSTSKFINGHGNSIGGAIVDTGLYDWSKGPFGEIAQLAGRAGQLAFTSYLRNSVHRDLGGCAAPLNSFLMLQGLEGLGLRMERHCANALKLAEYLRGQGSVAWVRYPGLNDSDQYGLAQQYLGGRGGALLTLGLGSKSRAFRLIDTLKLAENAANIGDSRTLVIHPASTIFHDFSEADRAKMKVTDDMVRVSVGVENFEDIQADFEQALEALRGES